MSLIKRNPTQTMSFWNREVPSFRGLQSLQYDMNRIFDEFFRGDFLGNDSLFSRDWNPAVDIVEKDNNYTLKAELPGMSKEDIKITVENNLLTIRGEKKNESDKKEENYHRIERSYGSFERTFSIPGSIKANEIDAQYLNGVLTLILQKADEAKTRMIDIKLK